MRKRSILYAIFGPRPEVGDIWRDVKDNPFSGTEYVRVIDVRSGWVKGRVGSDSIFSDVELTIGDFKCCYRLHLSSKDMARV